VKIATLDVRNGIGIFSKELFVVFGRHRNYLAGAKIKNLNANWPSRIFQRRAAPQQRIDGFVGLGFGFAPRADALDTNGAVGTNQHPIRRNYNFSCT